MIRPQTAIVLILAAIAVTSGCVTVKTHNQNDPYTITHPTWWNYYARGRLHLQDGHFDKAAADFETALGLRSGARTPYPHDRWKVRTYGMHMLEGYFPHRELGVCRFKQGQPEKALELLEKSLEMEPSSRAKYYISRIKETLAVEALPPPEIQLQTAGLWSSKTRFELKGAAFGENAIAALSINGEPEFIELAKTSVDFKKQIPLIEGQNCITISARDVSGKTSSTNFVITADFTPPNIYLKREGTEPVITCKDNLRLKTVSVNKQLFKIGQTETTLPWPETQNSPLLIAATDEAGNRVEWKLSPAELKQLAKKQPPSAPELKLADAGKTITLYSPEYGLDISAADDTALKTLSVNGENLLTHPSPLFRTLRRLPLEKGTNTITVTATDFDENRTENRLTVIYREPEYLDSIYRLAAALSPLTGELPPPETTRRISHYFSEELNRPPVRFYLLAADAETKIIREEQKLSEQTLADPRALLKTGRKLNADLSFITRILNDAPGQTVYTAVFDTESGEELFIEDIYIEDPRQLKTRLAGLVMKIEQRFPLIQSRLHSAGNDLFISAGEKAGAQKGMRFLVIRSDSVFEQGTLLKNGTKPLEVVISKVESEKSAAIVPGDQPENLVQPGDYVFAR